MSFGDRKPCQDKKEKQIYTQIMRLYCACEQIGAQGNKELTLG